VGRNDVLFYKQHEECRVQALRRTKSFEQMPQNLLDAPLTASKRCVCAPFVGGGWEARGSLEPKIDVSKPASVARRLRPIFHLRGQRQEAARAAAGSAVSCGSTGRHR
jgi:hypothetical protein